MSFPAALLELAAPATLGFFQSFHMAGGLHLCVIAHSASHACDDSRPPISCISVRYRLKLHFFQEVLLDLPALSGFPSPAIVEYSSLSSLTVEPPFRSCAPIPFETWDNLGKRMADMYHEGLGDFVVITVWPKVLREKEQTFPT